MTILIYNGDANKLLQACQKYKIPLMFADPPDNLGLEYHGMTDRVPGDDYAMWLGGMLQLMHRASDVCWLSYFNRHDPTVMSEIALQTWKKIIWRFTFGQNDQNEFGSGYRPILRLTKIDLRAAISSIRIESERQRLGDARANPIGRVPDDVWDFPRVTGNSTERRPWHPTQHPEALLDRIVRSSYLPGTCKLIVDLFAGTGSMLRVAERLGIPAIGCDQSAYYCEMMSHSLRSPAVTTSLDVVEEFIKTYLIYAMGGAEC